MANWAKLQEQLTGLPVVKRARHGIHFDKGNGEIVANFSGAPCHYEEKGVWKPIDTKLLLGNDGFYGCPHSPVKVHKDGRVKVDKSNYSQFTELPGSPVGKVDGDRIVREFKFGTQYLYMKEDGFRQETVITRPPTTAEAKYLIASESGELPSKYKRSDITAVDADGAVHEFVNLGQFKKWLDAAAYPVTIDPDFTGGTADGLVYGSNATYLTARSTSSAIATTGGGDAAVGQRVFNGDFRVYRGFFVFDTSSIGADSTVTQVNLKLTTLTYETIANHFDVQIVKFDWNGKTREEIYDGILAADADDAILYNTADGIGRKTSGNLSTSWVSKEGSTYYGIRSSRDVDATEPPGYERLGVYFANESTESRRPVLTVTYTTGGALRRINTSSFQQLTGGIHG